jgi:group I intron endonuclease
MSQDFGKGKIYKITNDYNDEVYIGSTCDLLTKRFSKHKNDSKNEKKKNSPIYKLMNEIGYERFRIELIENYPYQDKYQLIQREGHYIREIGTLNKKIEGRTKKQYYEHNKDKILENKKEYREANKELILENKKEYYEHNKDKILENKKEYYEANKDKIHEKRSLKIACECGFIVCKYSITNHKRSVKHQELMKTILTPIIH